MTVNILSISGGKDSTAMWLLALERGVNVQPVFADTGHEHPKTYEYIEYLQKQLGSIRTVKADFYVEINRKRELVQTKWREEGVPENIIREALEVLEPTGVPFLDLCIWKGRFPSTMARFCTQFLKVIPIMEQVYFPILDQGHKLISWQGIRAEESLARANLTENEGAPEGFEIYRPLIKWTVDDVFSIHKKYGIEPNPLYKQGMTRVGCLPCVNARKSEIFEIARRYLEEIERIAKWEQIVSKASKRGAASFFKHDVVIGEGIYDVVEWSKTSRGGKTIDLLMALEPVPICSSQYGLCE